MASCYHQAQVPLNWSSDIIHVHKEPLYYLSSTHMHNCQHPCVLWLSPPTASITDKSGAQIEERSNDSSARSSSNASKTRQVLLFSIWFQCELSGGPRSCGTPLHVVSLSAESTLSKSDAVVTSLHVLKLLCCWYCPNLLGPSWTTWTWLELQSWWTDPIFQFLKVQTIRVAQPGQFGFGPPKVETVRIFRILIPQIPPHLARPKHDILLNPLDSPPTCHMVLAG